MREFNAESLRNGSLPNRGVFACAIIAKIPIEQVMKEIGQTKTANCER